MNQEKDEISSGSLGGLLVPLWIQLLKQQQARCLGLVTSIIQKNPKNLKPGIGEHGSRCFLKHVPSLIHTPLEKITSKLVEVSETPLKNSPQIIRSKYSENSPTSPIIQGGTPWCPKVS